MQLLTLNIDQLKPYPKNARQHSKKQIERIAESIKEFGFTLPILINKEQMILAGHGRVEAARILGIAEVPVIMHEHLTEKQQRAYILADNRLAELSKWDNAILKNELIDLKSLDVDLSLIGFENFKFDLDITAEDDKAPGESPLRCMPGDIWQLGDHRLMCGDSTNPDQVTRLFDSKNPIIMVTDPPYGVNYDASWREEHDLGVGERSKGKVLNDDRVDWKDAYSLFMGDIAYIWHAGKYTHTVAQNLEDCGFLLISQIIWAKQHFVLSRGDYHWQHEPCWYAVRKNKKHNWQERRDQTTVWNIDNNNSFGNAAPEETWGHSTQKPIECMLRPILNNTKEGAIVYDPFSGSGTTLIACEKSKRTCFAMELDQKYCDIILARWEKHSGRIAERL